MNFQIPNPKPYILLVGGGGHCKSVIDVIELEGKFKIAGIVERDKSLVGNRVLNYEVIGHDGELEELRKEYKYAFITIGQIKSPDPRVKLFERLKKLGFKLPVVISPLAYVSRYAFLDEGTVVMHHALVNAGAKVGKNCIINTKALIEHDAIIGNFCHISTGAIVNGACKIGNKVFVGSNTVMANNVCTGDDIVIGAGSVINKDIVEKGVYVGDPVRRIR